jgi:two-component sensor histidine kinase
LTRRFSQIDLPSRFARWAPAWVIQVNVGVLAGAAAMFLRAMLDLLVVGIAPFALLFPALLIATLLAGWQAGAVTALLGGVAAWFFLFEPYRTLAFPGWHNLISLGLYLLSSAIVIAVADAYRRSARALENERTQQALLINELNHRVKNTLATVQSMAAMTLGRDPSGDQARAFEGRLFALSRAHDVLTRGSWERVDLAELVAQALGPFAAEGRIDPEGPNLALGPQQALALSMALHELATNAAKYGALSGPAGRVSIRWSLDGGRLDFHWTESGGPTVKPPTRRGFGSRLLETGLARELDGDVRLAFEPTGLVCSIAMRVPG